MSWNKTAIVASCWIFLYEFYPTLFHSTT